MAVGRRKVQTQLDLGDNPHLTIVIHAWLKFAPGRFYLLTRGSLEEELTQWRRGDRKKAVQPLTRRKTHTHAPTVINSHEENGTTSHDSNDPTHRNTRREGGMVLTDTRKEYQTITLGDRRRQKRELWGRR